MVRRVKTQLYSVPGGADGRHPAIQRAAEVLWSGGLVAFPTETVYGLGADGLNGRAVARIFEAKGRPQDNPLILHVEGVERLQEVAASPPDRALELAERFWPGPLTLVLPRAPVIPDEVTAGLPTVAVRCPAHPIALALIRASRRPIAAPSANLSGRPSPTTAEHVLHDLRDRVEVILDGGTTGIGLESTVLDLTVEPPALLRPGGLPVEVLEAVLGPVSRGQSAEGGAEAPRSPGMKYTHYSPSAHMVLFDLGDEAQTRKSLRERALRAIRKGLRVGILCAAESTAYYSDLAVTRALGSKHNLDEVAANLFAGMRYLEAEGCDLILAESFERKGVGLGIMDRLTRAADEIVTEGNVVP